MAPASASPTFASALGAVRRCGLLQLWAAKRRWLPRGTDASVARGMTAPLRVLVVDDEPLAVERMQILLARCGGVELAGTASNGEAALRLAELFAPDAILLDIAMPGMDGMEVARALAQLPSPPRWCSSPHSTALRLPPSM